MHHSSQPGDPAPPQRQQKQWSITNTQQYVRVHSTLMTMNLEVLVSPFSSFVWMGGSEWCGKSALYDSGHPLAFGSVRVVQFPTGGATHCSLLIERSSLLKKTRSERTNIKQTRFIYLFIFSNEVFFLWLKSEKLVPLGFSPQGV